MLSFFNLFSKHEGIRICSSSSIDGWGHYSWAMWRPSVSYPPCHYFAWWFDVTLWCNYHSFLMCKMFWCNEIELYTEEHNFVNYWSKILQSLRGISKTGVTGVTVCENSRELWIVRFNFFNWHVKCNCHILLTLLLLVSWTWNNFVSAMSGSRVRSHLYQGVSYLSYVIE